jgi:hypothetical protein
MAPLYRRSDFGYAVAASKARPLSSRPLPAEVMKKALEVPAVVSRGVDRRRHFRDNHEEALSPSSAHRMTVCTSYEVVSGSSASIEQGWAAADDDGAHADRIDVVARRDAQRAPASSPPFPAASDRPPSPSFSTKP